jgi:hypothetical protein
MIAEGRPTVVDGIQSSTASEWSTYGVTEIQIKYNLKDLNTLTSLTATRLTSLPLVTHLLWLDNTQTIKLTTSRVHVTSIIISLSVLGQQLRQRLKRFND